MFATVHKSTVGRRDAGMCAERVERFLIPFELKLTCTFQPFVAAPLCVVALIVVVAIGKNLNLMSIHYHLV